MLNRNYCTWPPHKEMNMMFSVFRLKNHNKSIRNKTKIKVYGVARQLYHYYIKIKDDYYSAVRRRLFRPFKRTDSIFKDIL